MYYLISVEEVEKIENPCLECGSGKNKSCMFTCDNYYKYKAQQSILFKAKLVDVDEAVDEWLCIREGTDHPHYGMFSYSNMKFADFLSNKPSDGVCASCREHKDALMER